jgi:PKD repeat protein
MNRQLRSLLLSATVLLGSLAFAQPLPPYNVTVMGTVAGCTPGSYVNILTVQNTQPALDIDVPLDSNCMYAINLAMDSPLGWFQVSTPCNGAMLTEVGNYAVNTFDSLFVIVDFNCGGVNTDCNGIVGGSALPGTACDDNDPNTFNDTWSAACQCVGTSAAPCEACFTVTQTTNFVDSIPFSASFSNCSSGGVAPFTYLWQFYDGSISQVAEPTFVFLSAGWHFTCLIITDSNGCTDQTCDSLYVDENGTINPGPINNDPCEAAFFVMQAYQWVDSAGSGNGGGGDPIPNELWVWNLSNGGTGNFQFTWDFGDGTTSTEAFPSHTYSSGSAYLLCLTIADDAGCTDTYCDSVSVDGDGLIDGMVAAGSRSTFTVNVMNPLVTGVQEKPAFSELNTWPNPVNDVLNIALTSELKGTVQVSITDLSGRVVNTDSRSILHGNNRLEVPVTDLGAGLYLVRISNGKASISSRFVKVR